MKIMRTFPEHVEAAAAAVGVAVDITVIGYSRVEGHTMNVKVNPLDGNRERYRRISPATGQKIHAVCWHGFRDFLTAFFDVSPRSIIVTAIARYEGAYDFLDKFESTGYENIGSEIRPCYAMDACKCEGEW